MKRHEPVVFRGHGVFFIRQRLQKNENTLKKIGIFNRDKVT